jgi:hypothetical protein
MTKSEIELEIAKFRNEWLLLTGGELVVYRLESIANFPNAKPRPLDAALAFELLESLRQEGKHVRLDLGVLACCIVGSEAAPDVIMYGATTNEVIALAWIAWKGKLK